MDRSKSQTQLHNTQSILHTGREGVHVIQALGDILLVYILLLSDSANVIPRKVAHGSGKSELKTMETFLILSTNFKCHVMSKICIFV